MTKPAQCLCRMNSFRCGMVCTKAFKVLHIAVKKEYFLQVDIFSMKTYFYCCVSDDNNNEAKHVAKILSPRGFEKMSTGFRWVEKTFPTPTIFFKTPSHFLTGGYKQTIFRHYARMRQCCTLNWWRSINCKVYTLVFILPNPTAIVVIARVYTV